jgi:DEAD/DEAH box helicase domain-containing protein
MGPAYEPNVFLYDNYPGGIGFSEPLYRLHGRLIRESKRLIESCPCKDGCPSCVGPVGEVGVRGKEVALSILERLERLEPLVSD